nr:uncharacterized protein LOC109163410 [Ipomoea trifida]
MHGTIFTGHWRPLVSSLFRQPFSILRVTEMMKNIPVGSRNFTQQKRIRFFVWLVVNSKLIGNVERKRRRLTEDGTCSVCEEEDESILHLLNGCKFAKECWYKTFHPSNFHINRVRDVIGWVKENVQFKEWMPDDAVVEKATAQVEEARDLLFKRKTFNSGKSQWISWQPPEEGWIKCNMDGAFKKGSGLVSVGGLFRDHKGSWILGFMSKIGDTNSFAAELWGLREGLRLAKARGFDKVIFELDSEAVINAMRREEDPGKPTSTLIQDFNFLRGCMREIKFSHTLHEGNTSADRLVNLGQAVDWGASVLDHPPEALENLLLSDAHGALIQRVR